MEQADQDMDRLQTMLLDKIQTVIVGQPMDVVLTSLATMLVTGLLRMHEDGADELWLRRFTTRVGRLLLGMGSCPPPRLGVQ